MKKKFLYGSLAIMLLSLAAYCYMYYPRQVMPIGEPVDVTTIQSEKYHNDCLHPCIRYCEKTGKYYMAQSPYYAWNSQVENPMYYEGDDYRMWNDGCLIADTPKKGFNSDPCIFVDSMGQVTYIWREFCTPLCDSLNAFEVTVGGVIQDGHLLNRDIFCINYLAHEDTEQAPVMINHRGVHYIYAAWYQYEPVRKNKGIAIWREDADCAKGGRMCKYRFVDTIPFESCCTVDKCAQVRAFGYIFNVPKPLYHDLWHFDLFEYGDKLYMVSVAEKGDNIMLSMSEDWKHFKIFRKPLVNNHYTENYCGYRQYYYKPTAFVKDDMLHVFYTANAKDDLKRNQLYHTSASVKKVLR